MQMVVVMRQLTAVLDELLVRETYKLGLTPEDALMLAWLAQDRGISPSLLAERLGRKRQSVQRALERLEERNLVERYESSIRKRTAGWALTERGEEAWDELGRGFATQDCELAKNGVNLRQWVNGLEELLRAIHGITRTRKWPRAELVVPPEEPKIPEWDY